MYGVQFTLSEDGYADQTGTTGDAGPGQVDWLSVPAGTIKKFPNTGIGPLLAYGFDLFAL
jgi:hypothetical protein